MEGKIIDIPTKFLEFFIRNYNERYQILMGGRRSSKTFSTVLWLYFLCSGKEQLNVQIAAPSYSLLQATVQDCKDALGITVTGSKLYGDHTILPNGSLWQFIAYDCMEKTVGRKCDILFLNEAILLPEEAFTTLIQGVRRNIILNFNPVKRGYIDKFVNEDKSNLLITTWKDNPYLTDYQREEFENIKKRAQSPTASLIDIYQYQVYYLGNYNDVGGKVFTAIYNCTDNEWDRIPVDPVYGLDFGILDSKDETALVAVKIYENCIYAKELIYSNSLSNNKDLAFRMAEQGLNCYSRIYGDWGGLGASRIRALHTAGEYTWTEPEINKGFGIINARKGKVVDSISKLLQYDKIFVTDSSINLRKEMDGYELNADGKPKGADHAIDAMRYAVNSAY